MLVLGKTECGEPFVYAVLVPGEDVVAVVGDVHGHDDDEALSWSKCRENHTVIQITC